MSPKHSDHLCTDACRLEDLPDVYENVFANVRLSHNPRRRRYAMADVDLNLTRSEHLLLGLFLRHPNQVMTSDQIICQVWGPEWPGQPETLLKHISRLREKLGSHGKRLIRYDRAGAGHVLTP